MARNWFTRSLQFLLVVTSAILLGLIRASASPMTSGYNDTAYEFFSGLIFVSYNPRLMITAATELILMYRLCLQ